MRLILWTLLVCSCISFCRSFIKIIYINQIQPYSSDNDLAASLGDPEYNNPGYDVVVLSGYQYLSPHGPAQVFDDPVSYFSPGSWFGSEKAAIQETLKRDFVRHGVKLLVSAFGSYEFPTSKGYDPIDYCLNLANFVIQNGFDGVDLNYLDENAMIKGVSEDWLIKCTKAMRQLLPLNDYLIVHSPYAKFFTSSRDIYLGGGYTKVNQEVGDLIDYYNVIYFNQKDNKFDDFQTLFTNSGSQYPDVSVSELIKSGIQSQKILISKPATQEDVTDTGFINPDTLGQFCKQAQIQYLWHSGLSVWEYVHDFKGDFLQAFLKQCGLQQFITIQ